MPSQLEHSASQPKQRTNTVAQSQPSSPTTHKSGAHTAQPQQRPVVYSRATARGTVPHDESGQGSHKELSAKSQGIPTRPPTESRTVAHGQRHSNPRPHRQTNEDKKQHTSLQGTAADLSSKDPSLASAPSSANRFHGTMASAQKQLFGQKSDHKMKSPTKSQGHQGEQHSGEPAKSNQATARNLRKSRVSAAATTSVPLTGEKLVDMLVNGQIAAGIDTRDLKTAEAVLEGMSRSQPHTLTILLT